MLSVAGALALAGFLAWPRPAQRPASPPTVSRAARTQSRTPPRPRGPARLERGVYYDSLAYDADPEMMVAGRVAGLSVVDSVELGGPRGARAVAFLVQAGDTADRPTHHVVVASGPADRRTFRSTPLVGIGHRPIGRSGFGAVDVDGDGVREPYVVGWAGGTGGYEIILLLQHPNGRDQYEYWYYGAWGSLRSQAGEFPEGAPGPSTRRWAGRLAQHLADSIDPYAHDPELIRAEAEEARWVAAHGRGYHNGPLHPRWERGDLGSRAVTRCRATDGGLGWVSPSGGNVMAVDQKRGRHFILRVTDNEYDAARGIIAGRRYVWLGNTARAGSGYGLLAFDKRRERLVTIPIPELTAKHGTCGDAKVCGGPQISLRGGRIHADSIFLTLPDSIDARVELAGATSCNE